MGKKKREGRTYTLATKKRMSTLNLAKIGRINFKDVMLLESFITEKGKIIPGRTSRVSAKQQNFITKAIKLARNIALISPSQGFVNPNPVLATQSTVKPRYMGADASDTEVKELHETEILPSEIAIESKPNQPSVEE